MEATIQGENAAPVEPKKEYVSDTNAIKAQLEAEIKAKREASLKPAVPVVPAANATTEAPKPTEGNPPEAKAPVKENPDREQQFRNKDGQVSEEKILKSNEHLQKSIEDKDARLQKLLNTNKELMQKHTKVSQDLKAAEQKLPEGFNQLTPELKKQVLADLEKDPVEAIWKVSEMIAERKAAAVKSEYESERAERQNQSRAKELDDIGQNGHPWVYTPDGAALFDQAFAERPWLLQSRTPYKDALRFINAPVAQQPAETPAVRSTPTLGGGRAVPPPSSAPTETPEQQLKTLKAEFADALSVRDTKTASELALKIKQIESRRFLSR